MWRSRRCPLLTCLLVLVPALDCATHISKSQVRAGDRVIMQVKTLKPGPFTFKWYRNNAEIKEGRQYEIESTDNSTTLTIKQFEYSLAPFVEYKAVVRDPSGKQYEATFQVPTGGAILGFNTTRKNELIRQSVTRNEGESLEIICWANKDSFPTEKHVSWRFKKEHGATFQPWTEGDIQTTELINDTLVFKKLEKSNRGTFQCEFGNGTRDVILRVKDKYAVLYPFIGIIIEVILLVLIILACERRQKKKKPTGGIDDDNNFQSESLMNKSSQETGSEVKQRVPSSRK